MPNVTFFSDWPIDAILSTMDPQLISDAIEYKEDIEKTWINV
jgi:hypothetical protein